MEEDYTGSQGPLIDCSAQGEGWRRRKKRWKGK